VLCVQEDRIVGNDNTVPFQALRLQIPRSRIRAHFVNAKVRLHQYCDGTHAIFHGPRCLAHYRRKPAAILMQHHPFARLARPFATMRPAPGRALNQTRRVQLRQRSARA
jgi:hypothetical protein